MVGIVVTVATQQQSGSPSAVPPAGGTPTAAAASPRPASASPSASESAVAEESTSTSPSPSTAVSVIRTGDFALTPGDSADLEHGTAGPSVKNPDLSWGGDDRFSALNGRIARSLDGVTAADCTRLIRKYPQGTGDMGMEGSWFCTTTGAGHVAAVEFLGRAEGAQRRFHFIVWDAPAPTG
ncbi:hypothetical protein G3I32_21180 [Streptomyces coelicoflavus]|uniref:Uncharacterized protein n=1 Tax=Streptomyces coelicoflavus TaxID=285562 RepID=A0A7K3PQ00_9ACTN|nr:hypothetical protein [Streptomyces coelicoflavus]NEB11319.1 hypothetical protein [Streptomyces coelicoflavus]